MKILFSLFLTIAFFWGTNVRAFEEPHYEVVALADGYEVRYYQDSRGGDEYHKRKCSVSQTF